MAKIYRNCKFCGEKFQTWTSRIKNGRALYCSRACQCSCTEWLLLKCPGCRTEFRVLKSGQENNSEKVYCSHDCYIKSHNLKRACVVCGKEFSTWKSRSFIKTCSRKCAGKLIQIHQIITYKNIKYYINSSGYYVSRPKGKHGVMLHRVIYEDNHGIKLEKHHTVHHINGNRADNNIENLELWTKRHPAGVRVKDLHKIGLMNDLEKNSNN